MDIANRIMVVTGGASGIGKALAEAFHREGARHVVVADRDEDGAKEVAEAIGGAGVGLDVADEDAVRGLVAATTANVGPIDLFMSNAGYVTVGGLEVANQELDDMWNVHVMSHVYAARAVLPSMIERGGGYLMSTASAAGLLTQIGSLAYSLTKHAAVALAEWLAIAHAHQGIRVSVLCPQAVKTNIGANSPSALREPSRAAAAAAADGVLTAEETADVCLEAIAQERFWVLPHPEVAEYVRRKGSDIERWLHGMRRFQERLYEGRRRPGDWLVDDES